MFPCSVSCSSIMNIYAIIDIFAEMLQSRKIHADVKTRSGAILSEDKPRNLTCAGHFRGATMHQLRSVCAAGELR